MDRARQGNRDSERQTSCASSHVTVLASDCKYMDLGGSKQGQRSKEGVREATKGGALREVVGRMTEQSGRGNSGEEGRAEQ